MWDLAEPGLEPMSPALAGGFFFFFLNIKSFNSQTTHMHNVLLHSVKIKRKMYFYFFIFGCVGSCCVRAFSSCGERGLLFVAVCGLLIALASPAAEHGL